ncbi:UNVERIFIED_CONTAM: hypothetical protein GTU68_012924 [Idotea baltica]|nr:hypothetical protein [Idotea baltica]
MGLQLLQSEYAKLKKVERPEIVEIVHWAAGNGDRSENGDYIYGKKRLREIDKRLRYLGGRLDSAVLVKVNPPFPKDIRFSAKVELLDEEDRTIKYQIVGSDESNPEEGTISWLSPIAKALLGAKEDDLVSYKTPRGERDVEVIAISY